MRRWLAPLCTIVVAGCSTTPPVGWQHGGAALVVAPAVWHLPDGVTVEIRADGTVIEDGSETYILDRAGRVYDEGRSPVALLLPDGQVAGTDGANLGRIGVTNAAPPGSGTAWLSILPDEKVLYFDADGERLAGGGWRGCRGPQLRTCTLVTHLVTLQRTIAASQQSTVYMGFGVGVFR